MKRTILFVLVILGLLLVACTSPTPEPTKPPAPTTAPAQPTAAAKPTEAAKATGEPIKIAIIGAMSGTNAVLGDWMKKGVTLAVEEKNAAGGIKGRPIQIVIYDDEADPTKSVNLPTAPALLPLAWAPAIRRW